MRRVLVESPFAGRGDDPELDRVRNVAYCRQVCRALALRGDAPFASHIFLTQFLDDEVPEERTLGIEIGLHWGVAAALSVVAIDRGLSRGMLYGIERARKDGRAVEWFTLGRWPGLVPAGVDLDWRRLWREGDLGCAPT